jgi:multicomponent Na+:H+ antiporter subunit G
MQEFIAAALMTTGVVFMFLAGLGILRMPDLFTRMSSTSKAATFGVSSILLAVAIYFNNLAIAARALAVITFVFLTTPIAAHMIARAAYFVGVPLWEGTLWDELRGRYDVGTHILASSSTQLSLGEQQETEP